MIVLKLKKKMYLPALSIVTGALVLLVLTGISTYRNLNREEINAMHFLRRQGVSLIHALKAGSMTGEDAVEPLLQETAKSEDIAYIYLVNSEGTIIRHSDPALIGAPAPEDIRIDSGAPEIIHIRRLAENVRVYELARPFTGRDTIVLGLKMAAFEEARHADLHHALIMAAIVVALGSGAFFFIFVIQNYYLIDKTLKKTQDYTREVVANMANGLLSIDTSGKVASYNRLALELLGLDDTAVRGMDLRSVMDFDFIGISDTLAFHRPVLDREILYQPAHGEALPLSISVTPILNENNQCSGAVIVLQDLREIKRLQEKVRRSEKLAAIGKLAAGVAHEIRNPLSSIKGFAQFLSHTLKDRPEEKEYADIMVREVDRIGRVVTDLLTYAKPLSLERTRVDLPELVDHTVRLVTPDAGSRNVEILLHLGDDLGNLWLDANQITQALLNLLLNAMQAVPKNGHIEVGARVGHSSGLLHLWVEDDGKGIPAEHLDKILDPFYTTREKGTGLGLAIVHKIAENHHGEIRIESPAPGKRGGTRICLQIPGVFSEKGKGIS